MKLVPLDDFVTKLTGFQNKLQKTCPKELIDNDWTQSPPHLEELNALKEEIAVRLQILEEEPTTLAPELQQKARNALRALRRELRQNPLHLSVIDNVRRELEALDRSLFAELILASQLLLGRYACQAPDLAVFRDFRDGPEMVVVPAGTFMMGSPKSEEGRDYDEGPQLEVTIATRFAVGRYPVTVGEFARFVEAARYAMPDKMLVWSGDEWEEKSGHSWKNPGFDQTGRHPVVGVNWEDAQAYAAWLHKTTGKGYRLLSEAEWEYACRASTQTRYSFGDDEAALDKYAWYDPNSDKRTHPVGRKKPNPWGLHDVHGNVWEWVEDVWRDSLTGVPTDGAARSEGGRQGPHVVRGGSWHDDDSRNLRSAVRGRDVAVDRDSVSGFRLARTLLPRSS